MRRTIKWILVVAVITLAFSLTGNFPIAQSQEKMKDEKQDKKKVEANPDELVPYPEGYRMWVHVRSRYVGPESAEFKQSGGMQHVYANEKAAEGYKNMKFPDGSIIVFDVLEAKTSNGVTTEGNHKFVSLMHKDSKRYAKTGGWGFEIFRKDSKKDRIVAANPEAKCWSCHAAKPDTDGVFVEFRK